MHAHNYLLVRDSWKEWFVFFASVRYQNELETLLGWKKVLYFKRTIYYRHGHEYWLWPLALYPITILTWWRIGAWFAKRDLLHNLPPAGEVIPWFWPKYLIK